jgi:hypothetical protein
MNDFISQIIYKKELTFVLYPYPWWQMEYHFPPSRFGSDEMSTGRGKGTVSVRETNNEKS